MLNKNELQKQIQSSLEKNFKKACARAVEKLMPIPTENGKKRTEDFAETFTKIIADNLSVSLAEAIDYYVKNIELHGTVITVGSPTTQTALINCTPNPTVNGTVPNTLKIT